MRSLSCANCRLLLLSAYISKNAGGVRFSIGQLLTASSSRTAAGTAGKNASSFAGSSPNRPPWRARKRDLNRVGEDLGSEFGKNA